MDAISCGRPGSRRIPGTATRRCSADHRPWVPLVALAVGLAVVALGPLRPGADRPGAAPAAVAQAADLAGHPVVGVWRLVDDVGDPLGDNYGLFHADGTYVNVGVGTTFLGLWRPTGENTLEVVEVTGSLGFPGEEFKAGTQLTHTTYTYDPATDALVGVYSPTLSDANGEVFISGAHYSVRGTRIDFSAVEPTPTS